ncbi:MAG: leucine-rich repeat domain-containing protein [Clostridia bacterium]|nr:leucine-rich repeat domain-containing protein [Clostridia bacterium]
MKKLLTLMLLCCLLLCFAAQAENGGTCGDDLTWSLSDDGSTLTVSGTGAMNDYYFEGELAPWKETVGMKPFNVVVEEGVTTIGDFAFVDCGLQSIALPESLESIGQYAFTHCVNLAEIAIPNSVTAIGERAFQVCEKLTDFVIPDGVTAIAPGTFQLCAQLASVTIPASIETVGDNAFDQCTALKDIYYGGTKKDWKKVRKGSSWKDGCPKKQTVHYQ